MPSHSDIPGHDCSCSSCFYKSASESPSLKGAISGGSKIDKLFLGKFLPMREQKLLDRLVRTRAIYDDIRNQLLAESNDSSDAKPEKRKINDSGETDTSSAILKLVNLVDKGAAGQAPLSECCSCCSCDSLLQRQGHAARGKRGQQHKHSRTGMRQDVRHEHKTTKHREHGITRQDALKHTRSDPCGCINPRKKKLMKRMSKALSRRSRSKLSNILPPGRMAQEYDNKRDKRKGHRRRESGMGEAIKKSISKLKQTKNNIESGVKKSIENIKTTKNKIKETVSGSYKKFVEKSKQKQDLKDAELIKLFESTFGIDLSKDENIDYDKIMEMWACDFECDSEECIPEDCFKKKKHNMLKNQVGKANKKAQSKKPERLSSSDMRTQVKNENIAMGTETKKQKVFEEKVKKRSAGVGQRDNFKGKGKPKRSHHHSIEISVKKKDKKAGDHTANKAKISTEAKAKSGQAGVRLPSKSSQVAMQPPAKKNKMPMKTSKEPLSQKMQQPEPPVPQKTKSASSVIKVSSKASQVGVKAKKGPTTNKQRLVKTSKKTKEKARKDLIEYESGVPQGLQKHSKQHTSRQGIAISARPTSATKKKRLPRTQGKRQAQRPIRQKTSSTSQSVEKERHSGAYSLKRCFCTQKLKYKGTKAKDKATKTHTHNVKQSLSKSIQTIRVKKKIHKPPPLLPYECEPMVCIPGECDPHECIKLIRKRKANHRVVHTTTAHPRRSRSSLSQISKQVSANATETQSSNVVTKSNAIATKENNRSSHREPVIGLVDKNSSRRQAVRISSTFSFNIEFYKGDPSDQNVRTVETPNLPRRDTLKFEVIPTGKRNKNTGPHTKKAQRNKPSRQPRIRMSHTPSQASNSVKSKNTSTKHSLRRCFCTLKLAKHRDGARERRTFSNQGTVTSGLSLSSIEAKQIAVEKGTKAKKEKNKIILDPNECEPYFCVPGECNPYQCLERIRMRQGVISKNTGMTTSSDKNKSVSSGTSSIVTAKNSQIQSNLDVRQPKKKRKHSTYTVSNDHSRPRPEIAQKNSSRQAVRIGSSMSVNVEFFKEKNHSQKDFERVLKKNELSSSKTRKSEDHNVRPVRQNKGGNPHKVSKNKGDNPHKVSKNKGDNPHKVSKNKGDNPHIVRKNKGDNPHSTSVTRHESQLAIVQQKNKATGIRPILKRCFCTLKLQNKNRNKTSDKLSTRNNETTVMPVQVFYKNINLRENIKEHTYISKHKVKTANLHRDMSSFSSHKQNGSKSESIFKKIFNSNIDLKSTDLLNTFQRSFYAMNFQVNNTDRKKLGKYECAPGVCEPGKCDPVECQQRIMKRLVRRVSTITSTENRKRSMSSETARLLPQKQQYREFKSRQRTAPASGLQYQTLPERNNKQAIRIGSNFSFDFEFSKHETGDVASNPKERTRKVVFTETMREKKRIQTKCVGSCTTRNHGDGESQSNIVMYHKGSMVTPKRKRCFCNLELLKKKKQPHGIDFKMKGVAPENVIKLSTSGQNTKRLKSYKNKNNLEPYECEPNICIPGECDPHKCLERIKKRNKKVNINIGTRTVSRNASASSMTSYKAVKGKYIQYKDKIRQERSQSSLKSNIERVTKKNIQVPLPTRQAVRLGSNFSFEVEFFKNKSAEKNNLVLQLPQNSNQNPRTKPGKTEKDRNLVQSLQKSVQSTKDYRNQSDQVKTGTREKSTKTTSFLKRCFCTAKLFKQQKDTDKSKKIKHSPQRFTSQNIGEIGKTKIEKHSTLLLETNKNRLKRCFCTLALHRQSLSKQKETPQEKRVVSHVANSPDRKTIHNIKKAKNETRPVKSKLCECEPGVCIPGECNPVCVHECEKRTKKRLLKKSTTSTQTHHGKSFYTSTYMPYSKKMKNLNAHGTLSTGSIKKRKHKNHSKYNMRDSSRDKTESVFYKEKGTKTRKKFSNLKPDECEPGTCVPGHCNPLECYERIKQRYLKPHDTGAERSMYECEPGVCTPGQCDPYECLNRIKKQRKNHRSVHTMSQTLCSPSRCVSTGCNLVRTCSPRSMQTEESRIVHKPRYPFLNTQYWQGVKVGSNVSLNIEFYKETVFPNGIPIPKRYNNTKKVCARDTNTQCRLRDKYMQANQRTENKTPATGKALKRCFCTAILHQPNKKKLGNQMVTVGRVHESTLSPFKKKCTCSKIFLNKTKHKTKTKSKDGGKLIDLEKNKNYGNDKKTTRTCTQTQCKFGVSNNVNLQDMETILPYEPKSFRKNKSITGLNRRRPIYCCAECDCHSKLSPKTKRKQSKFKHTAVVDHNLTNSQAKTVIKKEPFIKRIFCALFRSSKYRDNVKHTISTVDVIQSEGRRKDVLKKSKSERKTYCNSPCFEPKKSKSAKIPLDKNNQNIIDQRVVKKRYNRCRPQSTEQVPAYIEHKTLCDGQELPKNRNKKVKFATTPETNKEREIENGKCGVFKCALKAFTDSHNKPKGNEIHTEVIISGKRLKKNICAQNNPKQNTLVTVRGSYVKCNVCERVSGIHKAFDHSCDATCSYCKKSKEKSKHKRSHKNASPNKGGKHKKQSDNKKLKGGKKKIKTKNKKNKKCVCGSSKCAKLYIKEQGKKNSKRSKTKSKKPCVCGSRLCKTLSPLTQKEKLCKCRDICECAKYLKNKKAKEKKMRQLRKRRQMEDQFRRKCQRAYDRYMDKRARKFRKRGNILLWAESALDLAKVGKNVTSGATRAVYRTITDPSDAYTTFKTMVKQPSQGIHRCKEALHDSGTPSALRRVRMRFASMPDVVRLKQRLEKFGPTNFILHMGDRDPKLRLRRMPKKKDLNKREPDFGCSLFMSSLRKRPCMRLYYLCPWFYPHVISLLTLWKQLTELMLFLLAIIVWSPCFLAVETFRMFVCCCLCGA